MSIGVSINVLQQLQEQYGVRVESPNVLIAQEVTGINNARPAIELEPESNFPQYKSRFNTPVYELIDFVLPNGFKFLLPEACIVEMIDSPKVVLRTPIQGRDGSVKEIINNDDKKIVIMGVLINQNNKDYPEELMQNLNQVVSFNGPVTINDLYLNSNNVSQLVITGCQYQRKAGRPNTIYFKIEAFSDEPIILQIPD